VRIASERDLRDAFETLREQYSHFGEVDLGPFADGLSDGDTLINLIQEDWSIFDDDLFQKGQAEELLGNILGSQYREKDDFSPTAGDICARRDRSIYRTGPADAWSEKREEFRSASSHLTLSEDWTWDLHRAEVFLKRGAFLHRARIGYREELPYRRHVPWSAAELGAPPSPRAGRANDETERVLYAADDPDTAVAEVRPVRGHVVTVGRFRLKRRTKIVDLVRRTLPPNPFSDGVGSALEADELLEAFAKELGEPLTRDDRPEDYRASQIVCRTIRHAGYEGIRYPSAMRPKGSNLVLFDPTVVALVESRLVVIKDHDVISVDYKQ
jgi:RES domain-containing protein